ncbi:hypothetical protein [Desulfosporosinus sp.]|uniref:hypothetical protein n=1 Tax=Desulfosporosinus sp. TaxID=157907 RepID=UPI00261E205D|nr:hypothetical protein [Desulfosporosinus sp.]
MNRLESLRVERESVIMALKKENKNRVKLLIKLIDFDDEIDEILASKLKSRPSWSVNNDMIKP